MKKLKLKLKLNKNKILREYDLTNLLKTKAGVGGSQLPPEHIGYYGSHTIMLPHT